MMQEWKVFESSVLHQAHIHETSVKQSSCSVRGTFMKPFTAGQKPLSCVRSYEANSHMKYWSEFVFLNLWTKNKREVFQSVST